MKTLYPRPAGAKKSSSIYPESQEDSSPLIIVDVPVPEFQPPDASSELSDDCFVGPVPVDSDIPPWLRITSRKAMRWLRPRLQSCEHIAIWVVALNINCDIVGSACIAEGGISRMEIALPDLVMKSRAMGAAGILLLQNRPGAGKNQTPIDADLTIQVALICDLLGMPLVDHIYINSRGEPVFVRERGALKDLPELLRTIRACREAMAKDVWEKGLLDDEYYERRAQKRAAAAAHRETGVQRRRRR